ncbi:GerW family sporulation protein [Halalkalibacter krulwichiae]|uniref:Sporulation protein YtfJ (Spore_YtfJ) n=1 Tax=Halalkalibacter krulwichiae TaxID=199441 RepID=A0A1X9MAM7_9BACI|nr:spore germination protein GerW family protein [Halalkalibacter krulwichiae]ARK30458.1 hypothetical protein BkAM31D_11815 [Halalkalibacter krulwichiae]
MSGMSPVSKLIDHIKPTTTETVFGEAIEGECQKIVPVAKATYFVVGGGGQGSEETNHSGGDGGGTFIRLKPVGVYEVTNKRTRYIPTMNYTPLLYLAGSACLLASILIKNKEK